MKFIKTLRNDLPGVDFDWQLIPGKAIPMNKENVFGDISVRISGGIQLRGSRCSIDRALVNFKPDEKLIKSNWIASSEPFVHSIRLEFEPAHSGINVLGVGVQYAVDSNINGCKFTALLRVSDENGKANKDLNEGVTISKMNKKAVFLGAQGGPGEKIRVAQFDVIPEAGSAIAGFYINSLRLLIG
jgi:hypothetical protein